jgi:hypothetical protein
VNVYCETDELVPGHPSHEVLKAANVFGTFGNHPHNANKWTDETERSLRAVSALCQMTHICSKLVLLARF